MGIDMWNHEGYRINKRVLNDNIIGEMNATFENVCGYKLTIIILWYLEDGLFIVCL